MNFDIEIDPIEDLMGPPRFPVVCDLCERDWDVHVPIIAHTGMLNSYGAVAVAKRFDALKANPPTLRCPICIFQGGDR